MHLRLCTFILALCLLNLPELASASGVAPYPGPTHGIVFLTKGFYRITYENVHMPDHDPNMGFVGLNYLVHVTPRFYLGGAAYTAQRGIRGGFFTVGLEGGFQYPLMTRLMFDTGIFIGGGGGSGGQQGGGLMLRPHAGLIYHFKPLDLSLNYDEIHFPNGRINSKEVSLGVDIPFKTIMANGSYRDLMIGSPNNLPRSLRHHIAYAGETTLFTISQYHPTRSGVSPGAVPLSHSISLAGFVLQKDLTPRAFFILEASGAAGGNADGYAELLMGLGYRISPDSWPVQFNAHMTLGGGGGGHIDTGGGSILKWGLNADYPLGHHYIAGLDIGELHPIGGNFSARTFSVDLGYETDIAQYSGGYQPAHADDRLKLSGYRIRASTEEYLHTQHKAGYSGANRIGMIAIKIDRFIQNGFYLTGQAMGANSGGAGGYAVGLVGAGFETAPLIGSVGMDTELLVGASGGGGVAVGGGAIIQAMAGAYASMGHNLSFNCSIGEVKSIRGTLQSPLIDIGIGYSFSNIEHLATYSQH